MTTRVRVTVAVLIGALVVAFVVARRGSDEDAYRQEVSRICTSTYDQLRTLKAGYWDALAFVSVRKRDALKNIAPPANRRFVHRELVAGESRLIQGAASREPLLALRTEQTSLDSHYRALGVRNCSN